MPGAAEAVVPLLSAPDEHVAELAGAVLRDMREIPQGFLPQIVAGMERGLGWLGPALAAIPSEAAADAAVRGGGRCRAVGVIHGTRRAAWL